MRITLSGFTWRATSPSRLYLADRPSIILLYDGLAWHFDFSDGCGLSLEAYNSRDDAARAIADGINAFLMEQMA